MALFKSLSSWLERGRSQTPRFANILEFREYVIAAVLKHPGVDGAETDSEDPAKFTFTIDGGISSVDLTNFFGYITANPDEDADKEIARFIRSGIHAEPGTDDPIVAVIRSREYTDHCEANSLDVLYEPLTADLMIVYMVDRPDSMAGLSAKDVPDKDLQSLRAIALQNVRQWLPKVIEDGELQFAVLYLVEGNTMLSTSLVLLDEFWESIRTRFPGNVLIAIPRKDQLFIFDDGGPAVEAAARRLIDVTFQDGFNLLSENLYARRGGRIVLAG